MTEERWLTLEEFCRLYRVSKNLVREKIKRGKLKTVQMEKTLRILDPGWKLQDERVIPEGDEQIDHLPFLRRREVAALLGVTEHSVRYYTQVGFLTYTKVGGIKRYSVAQVRACIAALHSGKKVVRRERSMAIVQWAKKRLSGVEYPKESDPNFYFQ